MYFNAQFLLIFNLYYSYYSIILQRLFSLFVCLFVRSFSALYLVALFCVCVFLVGNILLLLSDVFCESKWKEIDLGEILFRTEPK